MGIFDPLTQLTYLDLMNNQLMSLPAGIFDTLTQLTLLFLDGNQLTSLPAGVFYPLTQLTWLQLGNTFGCPSAVPALGSQVDEWSQPRRVLVPDVLDLGIGSPVIGYVQSLKRLPPRLVHPTTASRLLQWPLLSSVCRLLWV